MGDLIVFEGLDGSGKSTQFDKLSVYLQNKGFDVFGMDFPSKNNVYGKIIVDNYLQKKVKEDNPYYIATLYANDRLMNKDIIKEHLMKDYIVLLDRYVYSNIAFQGARIDIDKDKSSSDFITDREEFMDWIYTYEFKMNNLPKPDKVIYFDDNIKIPENGDVLEVEEIQRKADRIYKNIFDSLDKELDIRRIKNRREDGSIKGVGDIFEDILEEVGEVIDEGI